MIGKLNPPISRGRYNVPLIELITQGQYTFHVDPRATKAEIKAWIEGLGGAGVSSANSYRLPSKPKHSRARKKYRTRYKRMIVTMRKAKEDVEADTMDVTTALVPYIPSALAHYQITDKAKEDVEADTMDVTTALVPYIPSALAHYQITDTGKSE